MTARELWLRLTYPLRRRKVQRELNDEMALHVALRAEQLEQRGMAASVAAAAARKRFGNGARIATASRDIWGWRWLDGFGDDLRYIARQLRRSPGFAVVASLTVALGVGLNATAFTFYDAVVLKPLPVADPKSVVRVMQDVRAFGADLLPYTAYEVLHRDARTLRSVVATSAVQSFAATLPGGTDAESRIVAARFVSPDFFRALGVRPAIGRAIDASDDRAVVLDHHMLVVDVPDHSPDSERAVRRAEMERRIAALPGVRAVAWTQRVPFGGTHLRGATRAGLPITVSIDNVGETYFNVMGMSIVRGRGFAREDVERKAPVMIVSEASARLRWPGSDPIGKSVPPGDVLSGPDTTSSYTVIGVVHDIRSNFLSRLNGPSVYFPAGFEGPFGAFIVRTRGAPSTAVDAVRMAVGSVSPSLIGQTHVLTMQGGPMALQRLMAQAPATVALGLALVGLLLAAVGIYGLISQVVTRRTKEIGVHMAIGARQSQVIRLVAGKTLRPVAWGALVGGIIALGISFRLRAMIAMPDVPDLTFDVGAFDPFVFLGVLATLALVVAIACVVPARRAARIDPTVALRAE